MEALSERQIKTNGQVMEIHTEGTMETECSNTVPDDIPAVALRKSADSEGHSNDDVENILIVFNMRGNC